MGHVRINFNESASSLIGFHLILLVELLLRILRIYTGVL